MTIPENAPQWLKTARTENANVEIVDGVVTWRGGTWNGGTWRGGYWLDGTWNGGIWRGGLWHGGYWNGGTWLDGYWRGGTWNGGTWRGGLWIDGYWNGGTWRGGLWHDGYWRDGIWNGGTWHDPLIPDRIAYMASLLGIVFDSGGRAVAYRSTTKEHLGRWEKKYVQLPGRVDVKHSPAGNGTCVAGLHATTAARAWNYFSVDPTAQLWRIEFDREDLLDCDGEKVRLRGGWCEPIPWPWMPREVKP